LKRAFFAYLELRLREEGEEGGILSIWHRGREGGGGPFWQKEEKGWATQPASDRFGVGLPDWRALGPVFSLWAVENVH